jgi:hypothetical protein
MAKAFKNQAAQGDFVITRIAHLPQNARMEIPVDGKYIIAHSETGHHHVISSDYVELYVDEGNPFVGYLTVADVAFIEHLRPFDTHEELEVTPGIYRINRQREYVPDGFRKAMD